MDAKPSKAQQSKDAILMLVGEQQPISRAQIAASTGFSPSWTSKLLGELVEEGLLVREGTGRAGTYRVKES